MNYMKKYGLLRMFNKVFQFQARLNNVTISKLLEDAFPAWSTPISTTSTTRTKTTTRPEITAPETSPMIPPIRRIMTSPQTMSTSAVNRTRGGREGGQMGTQDRQIENLERLITKVNNLVEGLSNSFERNMELSSGITKSLISSISKFSEKADEIMQTFSKRPLAITTVKPMKQTNNIQMEKNDQVLENLFVENDG